MRMVHGRVAAGLPQNNITRVNMFRKDAGIGAGSASVHTQKAFEAFQLCRWLCVLVVLIPSFGTALAADGKALYNTCTACHGAKGEGNRALGAPNIAGMDAWYLSKQLENFTLGRRGSKHLCAIVHKPSES